MWLCNSSIGRKVVMSVTGIALILFLTFHGCMNVVALFSAKGYNMICEFLGANWYAVVATIGLAALIAIHFIYALWLTLQNRKARGNNKYDVSDKPEKVEWASQNMFVLGVIICLGMILHLYNFWYNMMFEELAGGDAELASNGFYHILNTFAFTCPNGHVRTCAVIYVILYLIWLFALWFHLTHGMWSAIQTMGWSGHVWFKRWRVIGNIYSTLLILMFVSVVLAFAFKCAPSIPCQKAQACTEMVGPRHHMAGQQCDKAKPGCDKAVAPCPMVHKHKKMMPRIVCSQCAPEPQAPCCDKMPAEGMCPDCKEGKPCPKEGGHHRHHHPQGAPDGPQDPQL